jgi:hypothetical protein
LRAFKPEQSQDADGRRVFASVIDGMQAALFDVALKLEGKSVHRLTPESTLVDLVKAYQLPETTAAAWSRFLRSALNHQEINSKTQLGFFRGPQ